VLTLTVLALTCGFSSPCGRAGRFGRTMPTAVTAAVERAKMSAESPGRSTSGQLQERLERERRIREIARLRESVEILENLRGRMARLSREIEALSRSLPVDLPVDVALLQEVVPPSAESV
jgi:TolA-binding protein